MEIHASERINHRSFDVPRHVRLAIPQRFFAHSQQSNGDRHMYASRTPFIPDSIIDRFEVCAWPEATKDAMAKLGIVDSINIGARMRRMWR
jgi:ATP-dependent DNA helicase UvrD/PcrA